jgi:hypothetical protein
LGIAHGKTRQDNARQDNARQGKTRLRAHRQIDQFLRVPVAGQFAVVLGYYLAALIPVLARRLHTHTHTHTHIKPKADQGGVVLFECFRLLFLSLSRKGLGKMISFAIMRGR